MREGIRMSKIATRTRVAKPVIGPRVKPGSQEVEVRTKNAEEIIRREDEWIEESKGPIIKSWEAHMKKRGRPWEWRAPELNTLRDVEDVIALGGSLTQKITFGPMFNEPVPPGFIPESVTEITFGDSFNQEILPGVIPKNVEYIGFGKSFSKPLDKEVLPIGLKSLLLPPSYPHKLIL